MSVTSVAATRSNGLWDHLNSAWTNDRKSFDNSSLPLATTFPAFPERSRLELQFPKTIVSGRRQATRACTLDVRLIQLTKKLSTNMVCKLLERLEPSISQLSNRKTGFSFSFRHYRGHLPLFLGLSEEAAFGIVRELPKWRRRWR